MSVPKQHHSKLRRKRGRARFLVEAKKVSACSNCGKKIVSHQVCPHCGFYKGKEIINTMKKKSVSGRVAEKKVSKKTKSQADGGRKNKDIKETKSAKKDK